MNDEADKPAAAAAPAGDAVPGAEALARLYTEVAARASRVVTEWMDRQAKAGPRLPDDELGIGRAFMALWAHAWNDPYRSAAAWTNYTLEAARLWQQTTLRMLGQPVAPLVQPAKNDARFRDADWSENYVYDFIKQSYLLAARHVQEAVADVHGLPEESRRKAVFFTRQLVDAMSPSNFALTNPQVVRETLSSGGQNLLRGLNNLLADLEKGGGELRISMTDERAFRLGGNVATTPGKVVYENDLMQLIQYAPLGAEVMKTPLVILPPWINKFYILDLREKNSFIRWAVAQGHTVFVVSWVNPGAALAHKGFDDYLLEGPVAALEAVERATGERRVNFIGYCLGGTLLGGALAWLAARGMAERVGCATFFVSLLDFSQPGDLGVFIDEEQVAALERRMARGYLEGSEMAGTFNLLRSNDLVWSFVINNYLLGKEPFPFDLLYWNSDSTRLPAKMHSFYLRNMYLQNRLGMPGGVTLAGEPIDLSKAKTPAYFISTVEDHIAPWKGTYRGARHLGGQVRFTLGGSGHIAGIINPPAAKKYHYWTNPELPATPEEWLSGAVQHPGSWWQDWQDWIAGQNGAERVPARMPGDGGLPVIEDAPGRYVMQRLGAK